MTTIKPNGSGRTPIATDDESSSTYEALGISNERALELKKLGRNYYGNGKNISQTHTEAWRKIWNDKTLSNEEVLLALWCYAEIATSLFSGLMAHE